VQKFFDIPVKILREGCRIEDMIKNALAPEKLEQVNCVHCWLNGVPKILDKWFDSAKIIANEPKLM
jgi:hypothetical protein